MARSGTSATGAPIFSPDTTYVQASPQVFVEIYPSRVGSKSYHFSSIGDKNDTFGGVISATVSKNIREGGGGRFVINITPGGPNGINDPLSWTRIITPLSLVVIALKRGSSRRIVMVGVVSDVQESQVWSNERVLRSIAIQGFDFTYYFTAFSYYQMAYLGILAANLTIGKAGVILGVTTGEIWGPVPQIGHDYLFRVMLGANDPNQPAVLEHTFVNYKNNAYFLRDIFGIFIESFSAPDQPQPTFYPMGADFLNSEGSWLDKFLLIFRWPFYEFYIITANGDDYPSMGQRLGTPSDGYGFFPPSSFSMPGFDPVFPLVVARTFPLPHAGISPADLSVSYSSTKWDSLPLYAYSSNTGGSLSDWGFIRSDVGYSINEHNNMFMIITTDASLFSGGAPVQFFAAEVLGVTYSPYSIAKYGFRTAAADLRWLTMFQSGLDPNFKGIKSVQQFSQGLLGMLSSYYLPTPNMLSGQVAIPMWPEVMPGCRFTYKPFKSHDIYEFYITGITHNFVFGGPSYTTLELSRGLLQSDYENPTVMQGLLTDTYTMEDGILKPRSIVKPYEGLVFSRPGDANVSMYQNMEGKPTSP